MKLTLWWLIAFVSGCICGRVTDFGYRFLQPFTWAVIALCLLFFLRQITDRNLEEGIRFKILLIMTAVLWGFSHNVPFALRAMPDVSIEKVLGINGEWGVLFVKGEGHFYEVQGNAKTWAFGSVACRSQASIFSPKYCFVRRATNIVANAEVSIYGELITQLKKHLVRRLDFLSGDLQNWLNGIIWGEKSELDAEIKAAFRQTGTYHLLVVSGLHVTLIAFVLGTLLRLPALILYAGRMLKPGQWICISLMLDILSCLAVFIYAWITGMSAAAQRAFLLYSVWRLTPIFAGYRESLPRLLIAFIAQTIFFPEGFLNQASLMSWACYLLFWEFSLEKPSSVVGFLAKTLMINIKLAVLTGMFFGNFSIAGIILNMVVVPGFSWFLCSGLLLVVIGDRWAFVTGSVVAVHEGFLQLMLRLHHALLEFPQFITISDSKTRIVFLMAGMFIILNCFKKMSISKEK